MAILQMDNIGMVIVRGGGGYGLRGGGWILVVFTRVFYLYKTT